MSLNCAVCLKKNLTPFESYKTRCKFTFCKQCIITHIQNEIKSQLKVPNIIPRCTTENCKEIIYINDVKPFMTTAQWNYINDLMFKNYCNNEKDLMFCRLCGKLGYWIPEKDCKSRFECPYCKNEFDLPSNPVNEVSRWIWRKFDTQSCPNCDTKFEKPEGKMHVICRACKYEFCYNCFQDYNAHDLEKCSWKKLIRPVLVITALCITLLLLNMFIPWLDWIDNLIHEASLKPNYWPLSFVSCNLFFVTALLNVYSFVNWTSSDSYIWKGLILVSLVASLGFFMFNFLYYRVAIFVYFSIEVPPMIAIYALKLNLYRVLEVFRKNAVLITLINVLACGIMRGLRSLLSLQIPEFFFNMGLFWEVMITNYFIFIWSMAMDAFGVMVINEGIPLLTWLLYFIYLDFSLDAFGFMCGFIFLLLTLGLQKLHLKKEETENSRLISHDSMRIITG